MENKLLSIFEPNRLTNSIWNLYFHVCNGFGCCTQLKPSHIVLIQIQKLQNCRKWNQRPLINTQNTN